MTDHDVHGPAIGVIVRQLARARDDGADDDFTARTILQALIGHGWRQRIEPPPVLSGHALDPVDVAVAAAKARAAIQRDGGR
jgi:hypothetical protein